MDYKQEILFGKIVVSKGYISKDELKKLLQQQKDKKFYIGEYLLKKKKIRPEQLEEITQRYIAESFSDLNENPGRELAFCRVLLQSKKMKPNDLLKLLAEEKTTGFGSGGGIGAYLYNNGHITAKEIIRFYSQISSQTEQCPGCTKEFRLLRISPGKKIRCKHCKTIFNIPTVEHEIGTFDRGDEARSEMELNAEEFEEFNLDDPKEIGGYEVIEKVAEGGMGIIYRAERKTTGRIVALKVLREIHRSSSEAQERFKREAQTLKQKLADHKNIVTVLDVGMQGEIPYFTMEFIQGLPLSDEIYKSPIGVEETIRIITRICEGLKYAHDQGVVHRDIKPSNILIDKKREPQITDFGLAKCMDSMTLVTRTGAMLGTPCYMSPEQAKGKLGMVGPRSDIYAVGVVFYEMLTQQNPFAGENTIEIYQKILSTTPVLPSQINSEVPKAVDNICMKCLRKDPYKRYKNVEEMLADLQGLKKGSGGFFSWLLGLFGKK